MTKRSTGLFIVLLIFVPFYALYWLYSFQKELKEKTGEGLSGVMHILALFFTFGIYALIWQYLAGKRLAKLGAEDKSVVYLILALVGIGGIVNPILMQGQANDLAQ